MNFIPSTEMKINLLPEQERWLSSKESIRKQCTREDVVAFDVFKDSVCVGFALLRRWEDGFFLWDYAIDHAWQGQGLGFAALKELIALMKEQYGAKFLTTTYIWGNDQAKALYEKAGFAETDVVDEPDCHEVNMLYRIE